MGHMYVRLFDIRPVVFDVDIIAGRRYSYILIVAGVHDPNIGEVFAGGSYNQNGSQPGLSATCTYNNNNGSCGIKFRC